MNKIKPVARFAAIIVIICLTLPFHGCADRLSLYSANTFNFFDTAIELKGYFKSSIDFDLAWEQTTNLLSHYHRLFDIYNEYDGLTNLASVNSAKADGEGVRTLGVDGEIIDLIEFGIAMHEATGGKVNIALGGLLSVWRECRESVSLPDREALEFAAAHSDINNVVTDRAAGTLTVKDRFLKIDVGAIAKGFAAKRIAEELKASGITGCLLNMGGTVCPIGPKPSGEPWSIGIESPDLSGYIKTVATKNECVVTSGGYQRFFEVDGVRYSHIIDPSTLYPPAYFASVSVITNDPALGDALSTALFCMSEEDGRRVLESFPSARAVWIYDDMTAAEGAPLGSPFPLSPETLRGLQKGLFHRLKAAP